MALKDFKKAQNKVNEAEQCKQEETEAKSFKDERFWQPTFGKDGNANATIRFLGSKDPKAIPWVNAFNHSYEMKVKQGEKVVSKWFIENCKWSIKESCPICQYVNEVGYENIKGLSKKKFYITNIQVIKDELNKEAEGKVFLYKFGQAIFNAITECQAGYDTENEDGETISIPPRKVFNFDSGHDFNIKIYKKKADGKEQNQYDKCKFKMKSSAVGDGDEDIQEKIYNSMYDLTEFTVNSYFKSDEELNKKLANFFKKPVTQSSEYSEPTEGKAKPKNLAPTPSTDDNDDDWINDLGDDDIPF